MSGGSSGGSKKSTKSPSIMSDNDVAKECGIMKANKVEIIVRICLHQGKKKPVMSQNMLKHKDKDSVEHKLLAGFDTEYHELELEIDGVIKDHSRGNVLEQYEKVGEVCLFARASQQKQPNSSEPKSLLDPKNAGDALAISINKHWKRALVTRAYPSSCEEYGSDDSDASPDKEDGSDESSMVDCLSTRYLAATGR